MNCWVKKFRHVVDLTDGEVALMNKVAANPHEFGARHDLISEGDKPKFVHLLLEGFACRYKILRDGSQQIMAWMVPGDLCDLHVTMLKEMDHAIGTITPCKIALLTADHVAELTSQGPNIATALRWNVLVDESIMREWLVSLAGRSADKRIAHVFCELLVRLQAVGLASANSVSFPFTQADLGHTLGLSTVHVNRVLQDLRDRGLIVLQAKKLTIPDVGRLKSFAAFNPNYLHLT